MLRFPYFSVSFLKLISWPISNNVLNCIIIVTQIESDFYLSVILHFSECKTPIRISKFGLIQHRTFKIRKVMATSINSFDKAVDGNTMGRGSLA